MCCAVPFAVVLAVFTEFGPTDVEFWIITIFSIVAGFPVLLTIFWVFARGAEKTGWGRPIVVLLLLAHLQALCLAAQGEVSGDHYAQVMVVIVTGATVYSLMYMTEFCDAGCRPRSARLRARR